MNKIRGTNSMEIPMTSILQIGVCVLSISLLAACDSSESPKPTAAAVLYRQNFKWAKPHST